VITNIQLKKHKLVQGRQGIEGTGRLSSRCPSTVKLALLLSSFNSWCCVYVGRSCWMISTVAQGVLGRNRSLSVNGLLRSARIWAWQRKYKPS